METYIMIETAMAYLGVMLGILLTGVILAPIITAIKAGMHD